MYQGELEIEKKYDEQEAKERDKKFKDQSKQMQKSADETFKRLKKELDADTEKTKREKANAESLRQAKINAAQSTLGAINTISKKGSAVDKATAISSIGISLQQELAGYFKAGSGQGPVGVAIAIAEGALAVARAGSAIQKINSQKFASGGVYVSKGGGYVSGEGSGTSDSINARISNGESIINAKSTARHLALLSAINVDGGGAPFDRFVSGNKFASGGVFTDGGNANRYYTEPILNDKAIGNSIAYALINNFPPIVTKVVDINNVQSQVAQIQNRATL
jgi:hypothetical protein